MNFLERWFRISRLSYPVPEHSRTLPYTLGGIAFLGFLLLFASGLVMGQFFDPAPDRAHQSVKHLVEQVPGGAFIRAFHYWTGYAVILALLLHVLRVFVTGAYKPPRVFTWYFGLALLATVFFGSYFTGTVLKWDQEALDALEHYREGLKFLGPIGTFLGSTEAVTLNIKLYLSHVSIFPLLLIVLIAAHFYLINAFNLSPLAFGEDSARAQVPPERLKGKFPDHAKSILRYSLIYYAIVAVVALIFGAPVGPPAGEGIEGPDLKPPWPFLWLYGVENLTGRMGTLVYAVVALFLFLAVLPLVDRGPERDPRKRPGTMIAGALVLLAIVGLSVYAAIAPPQVHHHADGAMSHTPGEDRGMEGHGGH